MNRNRLDASPRALARLGGALYLLIIVGGLFGEAFIRSRLIVPGDAMATAANIQASESLWRFGAATELFMLSCAVALTLILFILLRPVSRDIAWLAVFLNLVSIALEAGNELRLLGALIPLGNARHLGGFEPEQLYAMATLSLDWYGHGFGVALIFFGWTSLVLGYLIFRSGFLPRMLGVLMLIAGASYLTNSFALILSPPVADRLFPAILVPAFIGEASLCIWLLVKGVDPERWKMRVDGRLLRDSA